jgi:predicted ATPase
MYGSASRFNDSTQLVEAMMPVSKEMRRLTARWGTGTGWPKRLEWIAIDGLRDWRNGRFELKYPIMAISGENGSGKSTVLQAIASVYKSKPPKQKGRRRQPKKPNYASDFFPDTAWEKIKNATIRYCVRQGGKPPMNGDLRKPGPRWRGYKERPERQVVFVDLSRIQPIPSRPGYPRLANPQLTEQSFIDFDEESLTRFSQIMGREYQVGKMSYTNLDASRPVPVLRQSGDAYSGFHQGAGETIIAELLQLDIPQYSMVLIDEVESSLHPRLQRRLIRDLAELARLRELQIVVSTHSPIILDELPNEARAHIIVTGESRTIVYGVTPEFAMTKMDDVPQRECDLYVEDEKAERMLIEIITAHASSPDCALRCLPIQYGASSVGQNLGIMADQNRFPRPSFVFLDGDQGPSAGCLNLPGEDAPERVVFEALRSKNWLNVSGRIKRDFSDVADACLQAMSLPDHHEWITYAANKLVISADALWQTMCSEWATQCMAKDDVKEIVQPIEDAITRVLTTFKVPPISLTEISKAERNISQKLKPSATVSSETLQLFGQSQNDD